MNLYTESIGTTISRRQLSALDAIAFCAGMTRAAMIRMAICAMIDYEADHLADVAAQALKRAAE